MLRFQSNEKETFAATLKASSHETEAALQQRKSDMDQAWDDIDQGWKDLQQGMNEVGIAKPSDAHDGMVRLNVGGSQVNVRRSVLDAKQGSSSRFGWTLGDLFGASWDERLPVDKDGRLVLDESPIAVKHLVHALLTGTGSSAAADAAELSADQKPYLPFVSRALGLPEPAGAMFAGRPSKILGASDVCGTFETALQEWFPCELKVELKYSAARDGWTSAAFHAKCDDSPRSITVFQVGSGRSASVVGGFSGVSWAGRQGRQYSGYQRSPGGFVFMLKDGTAGMGYGQRPMKWGILNGYNDNAVYASTTGGPCFGGGHDLTSALDGSPGTLQTACHTYSIPVGSAFLNLNGQTVSEIEVFWVYPTMTETPLPTAELVTLDESDSAVVMPMKGDDDVRNFGALVAGSLTEERMALHAAEIELRRARAKVSATTNALEAVYGPDIAAGKEDPVVELSARGTRMTTLRSTLRVCSDSALATRFDETKWPANEKDVDEHGRRVIDCRPSVFSKVLDVLRMRKRSAWTGGKGVQMVRVAVKAGDREAFEEFVNMQFPGCESFVMDYVDLLEEQQA